MSKTFLVTSALPYANGDIHLGHMVEHVQTDIFVRFQKLVGHQCYYMCADDAHGTAIMLSAEKEGVRPEEFIERVKQQHIADFEQFNISYDHYYSTHSDENRVLSEHVYNSAHADGGIIKKTFSSILMRIKDCFWRIAILKERVQNVVLRINMGMPVKNAMQRTQQRI